MGLLRKISKLKKESGSTAAVTAAAGENGTGRPKMFALKKIITRIFNKNGFKEALETGAHCLQELGRNLNRVNAETEEEFLIIGGHLQDFSERAQEISEASAATAGIIGGPELNNTIADLNHIFQQAQLMAGECEKGTDVLSDIIQILDTIQSSIVGFMKIVKTLAVLGTFVRVESARLGSRGTEFSTLATEILQLGADIEEKYTNILNESQSLSSSLKNSLKNIVNIKSIQKDQLQVVIDRTMQSLNYLTEKYNLSLDTANKLSDNYQKISHKISDIVMSLQFHDITRQQIEHVEKALLDVLPLIQEKSHKNGDPGNNVILADHICKIQKAQLTMARDKLIQAVSSIIGNLESLARDIITISQQVQELVGDASREGDSFFPELEESLGAVASGLNLYGTARKDLWELMQAIAPAIDDMGKFLLDIERIEIAIERIALNACIKAAHLGLEGSALGVLAEATQNLAGGTREQTLAVAASLKSINAAAQQLSAGQGAGEGTPEVDVASLVTDLGAVLQTLGNINESAISGLTQVDQKGKSLSADLARAGGEVKVHEYAGGVLDQVITGIRETEGRFQPYLPDNLESLGLAEAELEDLKAQYTMVDERQAHDQTLITGSASLLEEKVELDQDEGQATADDLGDNVELF